MTWWLSVFFFVNGAWVPGSDVDGWGPRAHDSEAHCLEHKIYAEKECQAHPLNYEAVWVCSKDKPAEKPNFKEPPVNC